MFYLIHKFGLWGRGIIGADTKKYDGANAAMLVCIPVFFNLFTFFWSILIAFRLPTPPKSSDLLEKGIIILIAALVAYFFYQYLTPKKRRKAIFKEFGDMSKLKKWFLFLVLLVYLVATVWLFFYTVNIIRAKEYLLW